MQEYVSKYVILIKKFEKKTKITLSIMFSIACSTLEFSKSAINCDQSTDFS
jgi:hypothetical protein